MPSESPFLRHATSEDRGELKRLSEEAVRLQAELAAVRGELAELRGKVTMFTEAVVASCQTELAFSSAGDDPHSHERTMQLLGIAAKLSLAAAGKNPESADLQKLVGDWTDEIDAGAAGYVTPKVGVVAHVADNEGRLLLVQRSDTGRWYMPSGWCDFGVNAAGNAQREVREETGLEVDVVGFAGISNVIGAAYAVKHSYRLHFICRVVGGSLQANEHECLDVAFFRRGDLPPTDQLVAGGRFWVDFAYASIEGRMSGPFFDQPEAEVIDLRPSPSPECGSATGSVRDL